jgi:hypothetical protein
VALARRLLRRLQSLELPDPLAPQPRLLFLSRRRVRREKKLF